VSKTLAEMGIENQMEVSPFQGGSVSFATGGMMNVDIVCVKDEKQFGIEYNGISHYIKDVVAGGEDIESGQTQFKRRVMGMCGFTVVSIRWDDWNKAREAGTKNAFLTGLF